MIIGTAGHIDHGKTSLIRRLTGRDTDRLPEEKRRGISIELGYAYVPIDGSDAILGFVDVPGHERFVHTMLAGATGIDLALLVIAADDGPMPQTREHLDILGLLDVREGVIALTKIDMVDATRVEAAEAEIRDHVRGTPAERWPVFRVSPATGEGIDTLNGRLHELARTQPERVRKGRFRLAVDRAFTLAGIGTIVTGTAHSGEVKIGDGIRVYPDGALGRVRSIHAQDRESAGGRAGERLALNLAGVSLDQVHRGDWIQSPELENFTDRFDVALRLSNAHDRSLAQWSEVHLHHGTRDVMAHVSPLDVDGAAPGSDCLATVQCAQPLPVCRGDRLVIRDSQAKATLGGGHVLDIAPPARGKRTPARLDVLRALCEGDDVTSIAALVARQPLPLRRVAMGWNRAVEECETTAREAGATIAAGVAFHSDSWTTLRERVQQAVDDAHLREPEMPGLEQNRLHRIAAPQLDIESFLELIQSLLDECALTRRGAFLARPTHRAELSAQEKSLWSSIKPLLEASPYLPPRVRDIARELNLPEDDVRKTLRRVARLGEVTLVALDHFFLTPRVAEMADLAARIAGEQGLVRAAPFRDELGVGRKVAIQILEFFDRVGYTRRVRDDHKVRRANPWMEAR